MHDIENSICTLPPKLLFSNRGLVAPPATMEPDSDRKHFDSKRFVSYFGFLPNIVVNDTKFFLRCFTVIVNKIHYF